MAEVNSYLGTAEADYWVAHDAFDVCGKRGNYNTLMYILSLASEEYLKAVIEKCFIQNDTVPALLRSHNLRAIYNLIVSQYPMAVTSLECKWIGDFYFDARYPGDDYIVTTHDDAVTGFTIVDKIRNDCISILDVQSRQTSNATEVLHINREMSTYAEENNISLEALFDKVYGSIPTLAKSGNKQTDVIGYLDKWVALYR